MRVSPRTHRVPLAAPLLETRLNGLAPHRQGKVRDIYDVDDALLMIATDRISAFDYVLGSGIPDKGKVLTQLSAFWFDKTRDIVPNHVLETDVRRYPRELGQYADVLAGRSMLVRKTSPVPVECVARGYLSGSGWRDYVATGAVCGVRLPPGLRESDRLPEPIFTPATKATSGHDVNISETDAGRLIGAKLIEKLRSLTMALYAFGAAHADRCGILMADTKFEFGLTPDGEILLIDEVMTPDSSRYWPKDQYNPGRAQPSFDKQFVRDYLEQIRWNKQPPVPSLPNDVVARTREKYLEAFRRLSGRELD
ncbi:MAG: phosphoribosylaminoimidazolesuccinocarboxamide synthase [Acidobacteria bacterium]|nr:phosphoribosylaminoimidazolesuccinocarboxamide synthase [Acidobacteriota bacterium]